MSEAVKLADILCSKGLSFYHFTDTRNLPSIRAHGILSMSELRRRGLAVAPGGNEWSLDADQRNGMDRYVHLCFFRDHPMEYLATREGRIIESRYLKIDPVVLKNPGVLISDRVANRADAVPRPAAEMVGKLDLEVIYTRTDWKDRRIQERLKVARLCEILIPEFVEVTSIRNLG